MIVYLVKREFDPETIQVMSAAFDGAWQSLSQSDGALASDFRAASTRERAGALHPQPGTVRRTGREAFAAVGQG